jgi:hypothetical protein
MTDDPIQELIGTARSFHSLHRFWWGWACPGCQILERVALAQAREGRRG